MSVMVQDGRGFYVNHFYMRSAGMFSGRYLFLCNSLGTPMYDKTVSQALDTLQSLVRASLICGGMWEVVEYLGNGVFETKIYSNQTAT